MINNFRGMFESSKAVGRKERIRKNKERIDASYQACEKNRILNDIGRAILNASEDGYTFYRLEYDISRTEEFLEYLPAINHYFSRFDIDVENVSYHGTNIKAIMFTWEF